MSLIQKKLIILFPSNRKYIEKNRLYTLLNQKVWYIRLTNKEYWNANIFFIPLAFYMVYLAIKARSIFFFSAANPQIPTGGLIGESKADLSRLIPPQYRPKTIVLEENLTIDTIQERMTIANMGFPAILKPTVGCRGMMVKKVDSTSQVLLHQKKYETEFLLEEFITDPVEGAVLYWKNPETGESGIQSVTVKAFLSVTGDGFSTVQELLLKDTRGVLQIERLQKEKPSLMRLVLQLDEQIVVEPIGNHCRGTKFLNFNHLINSNMVQAYDKIQADLMGCYVFRLDVKAPSLADLQGGQHIKILEINGVGADPAHIFDPNTSLFDMFYAYIRLWKKIYEVATALHRQGVNYISYQEYKKYAARQAAITSLIN